MQINNYITRLFFGYFVSVFCFGLLLISCSIVVKATQRLNSQETIKSNVLLADKQQERISIQVEANAAFKLMSDEMKLASAAKKAKFRERAIAFHRVAQKMHRWLTNYFPNNSVARNTGEFVFESFSLAIFVENSANYWEAQAWYNECYRSLGEVLSAGQPEPKYLNQSINQLLYKQTIALAGKLRNVPHPETFYFSIPQSNITYFDILDILIEKDALYEDLLYDYSLEYSTVNSVAELEADKAGKRGSIIWTQAYIQSIMKSSDIKSKTTVDKNILITKIGEESAVAKSYLKQLETTRKSLSDNYLPSSPDDKIFKIFINVNSEKKEDINRWLSGVFFRQNFYGGKTNCSKDGTFVIYEIPKDTSKLNSDNNFNVDFARCFLINEVVEDDGKLNWIIVGIPEMYNSIVKNNFADDIGLYTLEQAIKNNKLHHISDIFTDEVDLRIPEQEKLFYAEARYISLFLQERSKSKNQLSEIFRILLNSEKNSIEVVEQVTGKKLSALNEEFRKYILGRIKNQKHKKANLLTKI